MLELETGRSPHAGCFWPCIAAAHFEQGRTDDALAAWRQAWQASPPGSARRVRGAAYVAKLAETRPQQRELIEREAMAVLHEIAPATDALAGQNRRAVAEVLKALAAAGANWEGCCAVLPRRHASIDRDATTILDAVNSSRPCPGIRTPRFTLGKQPRTSRVAQHS